MAKTRTEGAMVYASTTTNEPELIIRLGPAAKQAHIYSCSLVWSRRLTKLYGPPARVCRDRDGNATVVFWSIPDKLVGFRRPRKPGSGNRRAFASARAARKPASRPPKTVEIPRAGEPVLVRG